MSPTSPTDDHAQASPDHAPEAADRPEVVHEAVDLRIHSSKHGEQSCVLTVAGELDLAAAPELKRVAQNVVTDDLKRLVIDLDQVTFLDSTGLGALISAHRRMLTRGGELFLVCRQPACLKVLDITALSQVFTFAPSADEAVAAPAPGPYTLG